MFVACNRQDKRHMTENDYGKTGQYDLEKHGCELGGDIRCFCTDHRRRHKSFISIIGIKTNKKPEREKLNQQRKQDLEKPFRTNERTDQKYDGNNSC